MKMVSVDDNILLKQTGHKTSEGSEKYKEKKNSYLIDITIINKIERLSSNPKILLKF